MAAYQRFGVIPSAGDHGMAADALYVNEEPCTAGKRGAADDPPHRGAMGPLDEQCNAHGQNNQAEQGPHQPAGQAYGQR